MKKIAKSEEIAIAQGVRNELENSRYANYISVSDAFKRDGWECRYIFMAGNCWKKGKEEVTCFLGKYKHNGVEVDEEFIHRMLNIDRRYLEMCEFLGPERQLHTEYGRAFLEGVKWADTHLLGNLEDEDFRNVGFSIIHESFVKDGWQHSHGYAHGMARFNRWRKTGKEICLFHGKYTLNGKPIDSEILCRMLHIDNRVLQVRKAIEPHPIHAKYGQAFLAGVRWADEHPVGQPYP